MDQKQKYLFELLEYLKGTNYGIINIKDKHIEPIKEIIEKGLDKENGFCISFNSKYNKIKKYESV